MHLKTKHAGQFGEYVHYGKLLAHHAHHAYEYQSWMDYHIGYMKKVKIVAQIFVL